MYALYKKHIQLREDFYKYISFDPSTGASGLSAIDGKRPRIGVYNHRLDKSTGIHIALMTRRL